ncbi:DNA topoisomerase 1 [Dissulfurispira thermophila]|uniref:DNA topoisomerase 1 n=1 Tax=Dissulfurispira thermophila TaxID=2715679 RepID=A0A7G1GZP5_9BACT|nr:type I DNA topoisomerase [Dissulfurispira thermophila]BCB95975.1 DNA topoisomerase 1 [Dissulfurispira thermophila]
MKSLVIVESPAKAKTINKILGKEFGVKASIGHIKDLPKKELGVDINNNFEPHYEIIPGKEKVIKELKSEAKKADKIYIATDPDREGEAIAYHIAEEVKPTKNSRKIYRVTFHEITERAVKEAIQNPGKIDMAKVEAQQARRILDRLVGYNLSPFLWKKVRRGLSAGRVQSVAVKLIVDREREIESFNKEEYWTIEVLLTPKANGAQFWARLHKYNDFLVINRDAEEGNRFLITNEDTAQQIADEIKNKELYLSKIEKKIRKRSPSPPFITSTLQQEAARRLRFPAKKTMMIAQQLYEGIELGDEGSVGLITYMRTDSFRVAPEAQEWARDLIEKKFGSDYIPEKPPHYKSKGSAQEAHEAIRPTYANKSPEVVKKFLSKDQYNLYALIWNRFIASQMSPAQLEQTTYIIEVKSQGSGDISEGTEFRASGTVIRFSGFMALYTEGKDEIEEEEGGILPPLKEKEILKQLEIKPLQHFTQPPPRYTEATLVKALEEKGIGRPSTYAAILSTIQDRKYVEKNEERRFVPTELGIIVNDLLVEKFPELIDIGFTAKMEDELDAIENARMKWVEVVKDFYKPFSKDLAEASKDKEKIKPQDIPTENICEKCGSPMVIKWGRHGRFLACTSYPECKNTKPLEGDNSKQAEQILTGDICEKCGSPMIIKSGRFGKFLACSKYPECKNTKPISTGVKCPLDKGDIVERRSKRGKTFWSCSNYPECKFAMWYKPVPEQCPKCNAPFLVEKRNKSGELFHVCLNKGCDYKKEVKKEETAIEA